MFDEEHVDILGPQHGRACGQRPVARLSHAAHDAQQEVLAVGLEQEYPALAHSLRKQIAELYLHLRVDVQLRLLDGG